MNWALPAIIILAVVLAWPAPLLLARARWTSRAPRVAIALWEGIALGGALSMFGALLGIAFLGGVTIAGLDAALWTGPLPAEWALVNALALCAAILFGALLAANVIHAAWVTETKRRQHRSRVDLLSSPLDGQEHIRLLSHPAPLAFCLPGVRNMTVLSSGLVEQLDDQQFAAVVAHERAHLRGMHHLVLLAFRAWHDALPWFPIASRAEGAVATLIEMIADDTAARSVERLWIASAIRRIGRAWDDGLAFTQHSNFVTQVDHLNARVTRLEQPQAPLSIPARLLVDLCSFALVLFPMIYLLLVLGSAVSG